MLFGVQNRLSVEIASVGVNVCIGCCWKLYQGPERSHDDSLALARMSEARGKLVWCEFVG